MHMHVRRSCDMIIGNEAVVSSQLALMAAAAAGRQGLALMCAVKVKQGKSVSGSKEASMQGQLPVCLRI